MGVIFIRDVIGKLWEIEIKNIRGVFKNMAGTTTIRMSRGYIMTYSSPESIKTLIKNS